MSSQRFTPEFKEEAVRQIVDRGYAVAEVSSRLGVSAHSLYKWVKAVKPDKSEKQAAELIEAKSEILRLRAQLRRTGGWTRGRFGRGFEGVDGSIHALQSIQAAAKASSCHSTRLPPRRLARYSAVSACAYQSFQSRPGSIRQAPRLTVHTSGGCPGPA